MTLTPFARGLAAAAGLAFALSPAMADPADALPPGPTELLRIVVGDDPGALGDIVGAERDMDGWLDVLAGLAPDMDEAQRAALADYLALNMPADPPPEGEDVASRIAGLPADGKQLFAANCMSCHGVESYYLLLDRDFEGWMAIFDAPYHRRLLVEDAERETFASYAARFMPIEAEDVPEEWRD